MRRSAAPSRKFISPVVGTSAKTNKSVLKEFTPTKTDANKARTTSSVLSILKTSNDEKLVSENVIHNKCIDLTRNQEKSKENVEVIGKLLSSSNNKRVYNVVWGKKSSKKHKTWEGDGFLEVGTKTAILKDLCGSEMGRATNIKTELIEEGYILSVGSKEVQIIEILTTTPSYSVKRIAEDDSEEHFKKPKLSGCTVNYLIGSNRNIHSITKRKIVNNPDYQPLIMPTPPNEHQWSHNVNKKAVVDVEIDPNLAKVLRPHQRVGVVFLYECVMGFKQPECYGAILADEMGLGKTLQCITLIWTLLKQGPYGGVPVINRVLIVTPSSLTGNWEKEFLSWLGREKIQVFLIDTKNKPKDYIQLKHIPILIISYEMFARYFDELNQIQFSLVICDEGHRLKNNSIKISTLLNQIECKRRIILTGTPIQNDLQEFYALANFVNPGCLDSSTEFRKYFEESIVASREPDAADEIKQLGIERAAELNRKTSHFILRRAQDVLDKYLPTKTEVVVFCKSSEMQQNLCKAAIDFWENRDISTKEIAHLSVITALKKICNHPFLIKNLTQNDNQQESCLEETLSAKLAEIIPNDSVNSVAKSGKLNILFELLKSMLSLKEKIVIVSSYTQTLDLIARFCSQVNYKFSRLDGSVPSSHRTKIVEKFNNNYCNDFIFLLSAKAGGVGLNLVGASRLVLFDSDWNPATDLQAMSRVWRDGQKKSVYLYRFLTSGTIEEKIYQRQISKTGLSGSIVDPSNKSSIRMSDEELKDLFNLQFNSDSSTHSMLNCDCACDGTIPDPHKTDLDESAERSCQLGVEKSKESSHSLKMNQLMQWEHHGHPFDDKMMRELGFFEVKNDISFIFKNKCSL